MECIRFRYNGGKVKNPALLCISDKNVLSFHSDKNSLLHLRDKCKYLQEYA